ncbi:ABC transporter permease [Actinoplanes sp. N902-109]|uniref:ABC transporter permease n=1 Tax=Actinoplanes sp. (strain N902-109) TaxID=649831 RepID=UPI0003294EA3|nr:ABC transporter permease [Actinoplanes sp. N902-109]AGL17732.1 ABC-2 type transporter superfamily protein [Actinoplanes sp. N902-109]
MAELTFAHTPPAAPGRAADLAAVFYREFRLLTGNRVNLVFGLAPTLVYLLLVNTALGNVVGDITYRGTTLPFAMFLLPMVLAMSVVSASGTTGMALFQEEMSGVSTQLWSWPLRRSRFLLGKILAGVALVLAQSLLALVVGVLLFHYPISAGNWITLLVTLVLAAVAFNGLFLAAAVLIRDYRTFSVLSSISVLVLVFTAPALSPAAQLPAVLRWVSVVNPVTYAINGMRDAALFGPGRAWPSLVVLAVVAVVANVVAARALLRRTESL